MKRTNTKLGKKLLGGLITCSLVFSLFPGIAATADDAIQDGIVKVDVTPEQTVYVGNTTPISGIILTPKTSEQEIKVGTDHKKRFQVDGNSDAVYEFSIADDINYYAGGKITKIEIATTDVTNISINAASTSGWGPIASNSTFTWSGTAASSITLSIHGTSSRSCRIYFTSITVYVEVPVTGLEIHAPEVFVTVGNQLQLAYTTDPTNTTYTQPVWSSDDPTIATVDSTGLLTGVSEGIVKISVTLGGKTANSYIAVYQSGVQVSINPNSINLAIDDDPAEVNIVTDPETEIYLVEWSSSDESVATVTADTSVNGCAYITPVGEGEATITATFYSMEYEGITLTCAVTVGQEPGPDPEPTLTPEQITRLNVSHFVERMYVYGLGRPSETTGRDSWVDILLAGGSGSAVARGIFRSPEFIQQNISNEEFVRRAYMVYFNTAPDEAVVANWVAALNDGSATREQVLASFAESPEWAALCGFYAVNV